MSTTLLTYLTVTLLSWRRSTSTFNCLLLEFFLFLLLFIHNDVICNIIDIESSISSPWLSCYSLSIDSLRIKSIDLWLKESLACFLRCLKSHLLTAFPRVESLVLTRIVDWLLIFLIVIHSLFLLLYHLLNLSFLVDDMLFFSLCSLGIFLHLVVNLQRVVHRCSLSIWEINQLSLSFVLGNRRFNFRSF